MIFPVEGSVGGVGEAKYPAFPDWEDPKVGIMEAS